MAHEKELEVTLDAITRAGRLILDAYAVFEAIPNARADISTEADRESQELILRTLQSAFPDDAYCAEEQTPALAGRETTGRRLWIIDPIDGTRGFAQKNGEFSVMIGFVEEGELAVGAVLEPAWGRLTYARRGEGCWRRDEGGKEERCRVSATAELSE